MLCINRGTAEQEKALRIASAVGVIGLWISVASMPVNAAPTAHAESDLPVWLQERFEPVHYDLTRMVDNTARKLDQFFGTEDSLFVENQSFLRVALDTRLQPGESKLDPSVRFRVDMPTTKKRLRLIIESDIEEPLGRLSEQGLREIRGGERFDTKNSAVGLEQRSSKDPRQGLGAGAGSGGEIWCATGSLCALFGVAPVELQ
jgi:hypothetical protein